MIGLFWKVLDALDAKQISLLTTITACSICAAVTATIGVYKGEWQAKRDMAREANEEKNRVTALKPVTPSADQYSDAFGTIGTVGDDGQYTDAEWELIRAARLVIARRRLAEAVYERDENSEQKLRDAIVPLVTYADTLIRGDGEQEAPKESKDANSKDVGDSR